MCAIEGFVFVGCAGFAVLGAVMTLVIIGVRNEERAKTLTHRHAQTIPALVARRVLRTYVRRPCEGHGDRDSNGTN